MNLASIFLVFAASTSSLAMASDKFVMPKGTDTIKLIKGTVLSIDTTVPRCLPGELCEATSVMKLAFPLEGCLDELGPVAVNRNVTDDEKLEFVISAFNIVNPESSKVKCGAPPIAYFDLPLHLGFLTKDDVRVRFAESLYPGNSSSQTSQGRQINSSNSR